MGLIELISLRYFAVVYCYEIRILLEMGAKNTILKLLNHSLEAKVTFRLFFPEKEKLR